MAVFQKSGQPSSHLNPAYAFVSRLRKVINYENIARTSRRGQFMSQSFGGEWTEEKLEVMKRYFAAYAQALKNQHFAKWYVDAFAGSGRRMEGRSSLGGQESLLGGDESDFTGAMDGSVRIALKIDPPFERYVFVERSKVHAAKLQELNRNSRTTKLMFV